MMNMRSFCMPAAPRCGTRGSLTICTLRSDAEIGMAFRLRRERKPTALIAVAIDYTTPCRKDGRLQLYVPLLGFWLGDID